MKIRSESIAIIVPILLLATYLRFAALAGFDPSSYGSIFTAYFKTETRTLFLILQFIGVLYILARCLGEEPPTLDVIVSAFFLLLFVSVVRHFVPTFLVSMVGDVLVILWVKRSASGLAAPTESKGA